MKILIKVFFLSFLCSCVAGGWAGAQGIYFSKKGNVSFFSKARIENIEADNGNVVFIVDLLKGKVEMEVLIKAFEFEKALMQQHFNENYLESDKYPKAVFKGQFVNPTMLDPSKDGDYRVSVRGDLTIHGVTKSIETDAKLTIKGGKVIAGTEMYILVSDYNIKIPNLVADNISKQILIKLNAQLEPFK